MKTSPGPWKWVPFLDWDGGLQSADGNYVITNDESDSTPGNKADANLIAAAPELLALLREVGGPRWYKGAPGAGWIDDVAALLARFDG